MINPPYRVEEKAEVLDDYVAIAVHVERWTQDRATADRTVEAIRDFVRKLGGLPHRGTRREDIRPGLRIVPFRTRTAVAFEVDDVRRVVTVLRVFYGGQDYEAVLGGGRQG